MRAAELETDDTYRLVDLPDPEPTAGEVLVRVAYAGVQWGDVLLRDGHFPAPRPLVGGFEASGTIVAVGTGVDTNRIGEPVVALTSAGAFAELVVLPAMLALPVGHLDLRTAGGFGWVTPTAYDLVRHVGRVEPGDRVLIHAAAGGVGTVAVQFARTADAARIVGVVGDETQVEYARGFGLDAVVTRDQFPRAVEHEAFDVILDPVGGQTRHSNLDLLAPHGRLVVYGNIASWESVMVSTNDLLMQGRSLLTYNSNLLSQTNPERLVRSATEALAHLRGGSVAPDITAEYSLGEIGEAVERLATGRTRGKSVIRVSGVM
jgi:NADPH2:quinone reductase